jgi:hypothetical protein
VYHMNCVRFQVLTAASMMFRIVFWDVLPCKVIVDRRFRGAYCLHHQGSNSEHHMNCSRMLLLRVSSLNVISEKRNALLLANLSLVVVNILATLSKIAPALRSCEL